MRTFFNSHLLKPARHLGLVGERCPVWGGEIETLLNSEGRNPFRCCWKCAAEEIEREEQRIYYGDDVP
jgi:hypothetical protein